MTLAELYTALKSINGFNKKVAYRAFPEDEAPALPFIVYYVDQSNNILADNKVYKGRQQVTIELYSANKDVASEALVETMFNNHDVPWEKYEEYIDDEHMYQISYEITI